MQNTIHIAALGEPLDAPNSHPSELTADFAPLVERHSRPLYRLALAVTRNPHDAEDVVQEAFLQLLRSNRWQQLDDPQAYLARIAWRLAIRRKPATRDTSDLLPGLHSSEAGPEAETIDRQLESQMHSLIDALPEKLRQPLALAALGDWKLVEIAQILGLPEGTVRRRIHTARQLLKKQWPPTKGARA